ncbi:MAG: preprotein translocase subunit SecE [Myxococcales bacterium]|nr:preprotein translocase subunit SecE [Myxococcales bacterium]
MNSIRRYIIFSFLGFAFLLWVTLAKLLSSVAYLSDFPDPALIGTQFTATTLIGFVAAVLATMYAYGRSDIQQFSHDVIEELMKVAWPDWRTTRSATVVVIITTFVVAILLGFFDLAWAEFTGIIYAPRG